MYSLFVSDLTFAGTSASYLVPDCVNGIGTNCSNDVVVERVKFYNIAATQSILTLRAAQSLTMRDSQVAACGATTNAKALIVVDQPEICRFENVLWLDIGLVNGFSAVGKDAANYKHLLVIGSTSYKDGLIEFDSCFWDESTTVPVTVIGDVTTNIPIVRFRNCYWNPSTASGPCVDATRCDVVEIDGGVDSGFHVASTSPIVNATAVGTVRVRKMRIKPGGASNSIVADAATGAVEVIDSPGVVVALANALATKYKDTESSQLRLPRGATASVFAGAIGNLLKLAAVSGQPGYDLLAATDVAALAVGSVALLDATNAVAHAACPNQQVTLVSDGSTAISDATPSQTRVLSPQVNARRPAAPMRCSPSPCRRPHRVAAR